MLDQIQEAMKLPPEGKEFTLEKSGEKISLTWVSPMLEDKIFVGVEGENGSIDDSIELDAISLGGQLNDFNLKNPDGLENRREAAEMIERQLQTSGSFAAWQENLSKVNELAPPSAEEMGKFAKIAQQKQER